MTSINGTKIGQFTWGFAHRSCHTRHGEDSTCTSGKARNPWSVNQSRPFQDLNWNSSRVKASSTARSEIQGRVGDYLKLRNLCKLKSRPLRNTIRTKNWKARQNHWMSKTPQIQVKAVKDAHRTSARSTQRSSSTAVHHCKHKAAAFPRRSWLPFGVLV